MNKKPTPLEVKDPKGLAQEISQDLKHLSSLDGEDFDADQIPAGYQLDDWDDN